MRHKIKTLLLEHDTNDIEMVARELGKSTFTHALEVVSTRDEFEKALINFLPDLILSDFSLPSFDAFTAFLIKQRISSETPFIIVSGTVGEETAVELIKSGVTDYVLKDKLFTLNGKIERALVDFDEKRKRIVAEKKMIESEKRLEDAQAIAHIGSWEVNLVTKKEIWSNEVYNILGIKKENIPPSLDLFLSFIHPDDREAVRKIVIAARKNFEPFSYNARIVIGQGEIRHIYSHGKYISDPDDKPVRQLGILQDVTATKKLEEELKASNKELETFIYRASHDLRGPLSSIIGLTTLTKKEITDGKSLKYFSMVEDSAKKLDATLISLVQSMTMRDMTLTYETFDVNDLIKDIMSQLQYHEGFSRIQFNIESTLTKKIISSKLILKSVFQNLIQNSIKYQNHRSIPSFLKIKISLKNDLLHITFEDNGIGIESSFQEKIFDMYFRGTSEVSGSGLGLYIVKIGIEKLGGTIKLQSQSGKGSSFTVDIPNVKVLEEATVV